MRISRSDSEIPPERFLAAYFDDELILVLRRGAGPIYPADEDAEPLLAHPALSGQFVIMEQVPKILEALRRNETVELAVKALEALGLEVVDTPASALEWL